MNERGLTTVLKGIYAFVMKRIDALSKRIESITASKIGAMQEKDPAGTGTFSMNREASSAKGDYSSTLGKDCTASGRYAHAEGYLTVASGEYSHAEGAKTVARGLGSHAEGISSGAWANGSHAEGSSTTASGSYSHAEGECTTASGVSAHAEGHITAALSSNQHVQGRCNIGDAEGKYAHIVGNGTMDKRSNAHTLDWSGNSWYAGKVTAQGYEVEAGGASHALAASDVGAISDSDGSVQNAHLASGAVTTDKLAEAERMTSANIVGALGYGQSGGTYEMIEEIAVGDTATRIVRTEEPDGTPYAFEGMIVLGVCPAGKTAALFQGSYSTPKRTETLWSATGSTYSTVHYAHSIWEKWHGRWRRGRSTAWYADDEFIQDNVLYARCLAGNTAFDGEHITKVDFTGGAGLTFRIYGIRA